MRKYGIPARGRVACQTVFRVFWCPLGFSSLGNRYGLHGDRRSWSRKASTAKGVNGTSATPLGVLESGIQTTAFSRSRCCFFMDHQLLVHAQPRLGDDPHGVAQVFRSMNLNFTLFRPCE